MKNLRQQTTFFFWQYPILWLPLILADTLGFSLRQLQKLATRQIVFWTVEHGQHSVLGHAPIPPLEQASVTTKAAILSAPFVWGAQYIYVCLYIAALVITAAMVKSLAERSVPDLQSALSTADQRSKGIFWLSFKMVGLFAFAAILSSVPIWLFNSIRPSQRLPIVYQSITITFFFSAAVAYLMTPSAVRLLLRQSAFPVSAESKKLSRIAAIVAALASAALGVLQLAMAKSFYGTHLAILGFDLASSLIIATPYIPLFIFLGLIVTNGQSNLGDQKDETHMADLN